MFGVDILASNKGRLVDSKNNKTYGGTINTYKYLRIAGKRRAVHQIICTAFYGPSPGKNYVVNHIDNNGFNNDQSNLEWITFSDNVKHGRKFSDKSVYLHNIRAVRKYTKDGTFIEQYESITEAARRNKCAKSNIQGACKGRTASAGGFVWKYVES